jgi:hypothetical protein
MFTDAELKAMSEEELEEYIRGWCDCLSILVTIKDAGKLRETMVKLKELAKQGRCDELKAFKV